MSDPLAPFDFDLPEGRIALRPAQPQHAARLLVVHRDGRLEDSHMLDLPGYLSASDVLVFNNTRVLTAALKAVRPARNADGQAVAIDINLVEKLDASCWRALARPGKRLKPGDLLVVADGFTAKVSAKFPDGELDLVFNLQGDALLAALEEHGAMPLPPYIARRRAADESDRQAYQTSYAQGEAESVAAPTAGLHFTPHLLQAIDETGAARESVRLTVGLGTFAPLGSAQLQSGRLHGEWRELSADLAHRLNARRAAGGRIIPVGTTALRTLESAVNARGELRGVSGLTDIFLRPGDRLRATDALITNFHLPRSSLFMLVCALMGTDIMQAAYAHAISNNYRFYSYGDGCLLLP